MSWNASYNALLTGFCEAATDRIIGAGFVLDGKYLVTCAHVVNTSLGRAQLDISDCSGQTVRCCLLMPEGGNARTFFEAVVEIFIPAQAGEWIFRNDLALLRITGDTGNPKLADHAMAVPLVAGNPLVHQFRCFAPDIQRRECVEISGDVGMYMPVDGKTQLTRTAGSTSPFFKAGCSGSPIYSTSLGGITGIVSRIDNDSNAISAGMIDVRRMAEVFPGKILLHENAVARKPNARKNLRVNAKYLCDREEVLTDMALASAEKKSPVYFLYGSELQEGTTFNKRYRMRFFDQDDLSGSADMIAITLPFESNLLRFKSKIFDRLSTVADSFGSDADFGEHSDIFQLSDLLGDLKHKLIIIKVTDYQPAHEACLSWFCRSFLHFGGSKKLPENLHLLVMYVYPPTDSDAEIKRSALLSFFNSCSASFELRSVSRNEVDEWLDFIEPEDESRFKRQLKAAFTGKTAFGMQEIIDKYDEIKPAVSGGEK